MSKDIRKRHVLTKYHISRTALEGWIRTVRKHGYIRNWNYMYSGVKADLPKLWQDLRKKEPQTELEKLQAERPMPEGRECVAKK